MCIRMVMPVTLLLLGIGGMLYGFGWRDLTVQVEEEKQLPAPPPPPPFFQGNFPPPPPRPSKPIIIIREIDEPEYILVLEVTRGGVALTEEGQLKRTYHGAPPSGCPT